VALFHRRVIQQRLNDICHLLTWEQGEHLVARLNAPGYRAVSAEWEIVLLFAVSRLTSVQYEPALGGGRSADLVMQIPGDSSVFADIVAVSDAGIRRLNPLDEFQDEIARLLARKGIPNRGFEYRIESRQTSVGPKKIVWALALPAPADYRTALGDEFLSFLDRIGEDPSSEHTYVFPPPYHVALSYLPGRKHNTGTHPGTMRTKPTRRRSSVRSKRSIDNSDRFPGTTPLAYSSAMLVRNCSGSPGVRSSRRRSWRRKLSVSFPICRFSR
jgi:hypothetical protein